MKLYNVHGASEGNKIKEYRPGELFFFLELFVWLPSDLCFVSLTFLILILSELRLTLIIFQKQNKTRELIHPTIEIALHATLGLEKQMAKTMEFSPDKDANHYS